MNSEPMWGYCSRAEKKKKKKKEAENVDVKNAVCKRSHCWQRAIRDWWSLFMTLRVKSMDESWMRVKSQERRGKEDWETHGLL